jgi:hypothetical protein
MRRLALLLLLGPLHAASAQEDGAWTPWKLLHEPRTILVDLQQCAQVQLDVRATRGRRGHLLLHVDDAPLPQTLPVEIRAGVVIEARHLEVERVRTGYRGRVRVLGACTGEGPRPPA